MDNNKRKDRSAEDYMVPKTKTISIFKKIMHQTKKGNLDWSELDDGIFVADLGNFSLRVNENALYIYDLKSNLLATVKNVDLSREDDDITSLFQCAQVSSLKVFEKLNELEKNLDGIL